MPEPQEPYREVFVSKKDREAVIYLFGQPCKLRVHKNIIAMGFTPEFVVETLEKNLLGRDFRSKDVDVHAS
jgi:hypothetical protein